MHRRHLLTLATLLFATALPTAHAEPLPPAVKAEIHALLGQLEASGCQFNRNGTWYSSQEARSHLERKLDHVEKKAKAPTTEAFIELAASTSSMTGKPYLVQCQGASAVPSAQWLSAKLAALRKR